MDKIFIAAPIRDIKAYAIPSWLKSIDEIDWPEKEVLAVDNSDTPAFAEAIDAKDKTIVQMPNMAGLEPEMRLVISREKMREEFLKSDAAYWFSWECDIILPPDALKILMSFMDRFDVVNHCYPDRDDKTQEIGGIGCSLFKREILERFDFLDGGGFGYCDPLVPRCYYGGDSWLMKRVLRAGYKMCDLHNVIDIKHLNPIEASLSSGDLK
jgi:hypothetical protein